MSDVAAAVGVSPMTVSRAFRRDASVSLKTREKILETAAALGYVFDSRASTLRSQKTGFVAVTIPSINNANFADTVGAISAELAQSDLQVLLGYTNYDLDDEERLIEQLLRRRPEALIVTGGSHSAHARTMMSNAGIPVVQMWDEPQDPVDMVVGFSNGQAMQLMVRHMIDQGRRNLVFLGGDDRSDVRGAERREGFITAMRSAGLPADRLVDTGTPPVSMHQGALAMQQALRQYPDLNGVVCVSDLSAFGAMSECQRQQVPVPDQVAIGGFGAYDISGQSVPEISTVEVHSKEIGTRAAQAALAAINGNATQQDRIQNVVPVLIPRASTQRD
ncbi:LacI family DNA-binding transcriptional regulator [Algirhabdus cladophorae]|uniref:LacI family DNA-binding transcriptional regulator n=1 Tax=Algirhabdus cladophorae TaxID=3377108 RepID=UPI003B848355